MIIGLISDATGELQYSAEFHPPLAMPFALDGFSWVEMDEHLVRGPTRSPTEVPTYWEQKVKWVETASLDELKARKNAEIDVARESANRTYFDFDEKRIACGDVDWKGIMSASAEIALTRQMPADWVGFWKGKDPGGNTKYVAIPDVATWTLFIQAMVARGQTHFRKSQALKASLATATTAEEIAAITW